jgi:predicted outer membrane repeat protein
VYSSGNFLIEYDNCHFRYNEARNPFTLGGSYRSGGALYIAGSGSVNINRCIFDNNRAHAGGAIYSRSILQIDNSLFTNNYVESYEVQEWLSAGDYGGAISTHSYSPVFSVVRNSTFVGNSAGEGGGIATLGEHPMDVYNSIFQDNIATGSETKPLDPSFSGTGDFFYSNMQGIFTQEIGEDPPDSTNSPGCMDENPLFINAALYDYRPGAGSPCIDAGDNDFILSLSPDLSGGIRLLDDLATVDTGNGIAPITDMGAYEFSNPLPAPAAPYLGIAPFDNTVRLSWTPSSGAQIYHIYGTSNGGTQTLLETTTLTFWTMPFALFDSSHNWNFVVRAE